MKNLFTRKNIGWALTGLLGFVLLFSAYGKLSGAEQIVTMLSSNNLADWITIIGIGELASIILFIIPKTMKLGTLLLSAYFGGAIMFHMAHPSSDPELSGFLVPAVLLVFTWIISWVRGLEIFDLGS